MGGKNTICCVAENRFQEQEERLDPISSLNPILYTCSVSNDNESLEKFEFSYDNIVKYINTSFEIKFHKNSEFTEKLSLFNIKEKDLIYIKKLGDRETVYLLNNVDNLNSKKYILKVLRFNYEDTIVSQEDINRKFPLQYFENKNIFKELRITRNHKNHFFVKCNGYYIDDMNSKMYFVYDYYEYSIEKFIKEKLLDFHNKVKIMKNLIETLKSLHTEGIISLDLSISSVRFTAKKFNVKLVSLGNSFDMKSAFDIDRNSKMDRNKGDIHNPPEIVLKHIEKINWHCDIWALGVILSMLFSGEVYEISHNLLIDTYKDGKIPEFFYNNIDNVFIKSIVIGMLRIDPIERPNIFEIIDVFNNLVKHLAYDDSYLISYTKDEVLEFTSIFQKSTYIILNDELNNINHRDVEMPINHFNNEGQEPKIFRETIN